MRALERSYHGNGQHKPPVTIQDFGKPLQQGMLSHGFRLGSHRLDQLVVMIQIDQNKKKGLRPPKYFCACDVKPRASAIVCPKLHVNAATAMPPPPWNPSYVPR